MIDLPEITKSETQLLKDLSKIIFKWNTSKQYSSSICNCQQFVQEVIQSGLGIDFNENEYSSYIRDIISILQKNGNYELQNLFQN